MSAQKIREIFNELANPEDAAHLQRFFKTGKGEYGEGDKFLGIRVPETRKQVKLHSQISLKSTIVLLKSPYHEIRLFALLVLVEKFQKGTNGDKREIYGIYLDHTRYINNWDLVDLTAHWIVGAYLEDCSRKPLYKLAKSKSLWERRIAILATFYFIRQKDFDDALNIADILLNDAEDLIHKAVGWMLREIGKRDLKTEKRFLANRYQKMPRTMLRYAIEKFPEKERQRYLAGLV
jgi:3-methyladenine DNA glycosylase AlkD